MCFALLYGYSAVFDAANAPPSSLFQAAVQGLCAVLFVLFGLMIEQWRFRAYVPQVLTVALLLAMVPSAV